MTRMKLMDAKLGGGLTRQKKEADKDDDWEDIDEHERDVFDKDGYYDVLDEEVGISGNDL